MVPQKVLLIGYGSIGKRHARNLVELNIKPYILTNYPDNLDAVFLKDINGIKSENIDYCIIATPTAMHLEDLQKCISLSNIPKRILIEKPLEYSYLRGEEIKNLAEKYNFTIYVAYNMRYLKVFDIIKNFIYEQKDSIRIVEVIAGQDLKEWRPYKSYTQSYSAHRDQGGGVDLDLSHEIDYILWLFGGEFKEKVIFRDKISNLEINSPDIFKLILNYNKFIVDITLDYIRKPKERYIKIICENGKKLIFDFTTNLLKIDDEIIEIAYDLNLSYKEELRDFLDMSNEKRIRLCTLEEGLNVLEILEV